jgi:hypothetical protein
MSAYKQLVGCGFAVTLAISVFGCGSSDSSSNSSAGSSMDEMAGAVDAQNAARKEAEAAVAAKAAADQKAAEAAAAAQPPERTVAGRGQMEQGGYLTAIAGARRHVLNTVDDLAWIQAVQHFQATEGRLPRDHAEFMSKVVIPLGLNLGHIEEGQEFLYDPQGESDAKVGQLYVVEKTQDSAAK